MALLRTSNPALNERAFQLDHAALGESMTVPGTINKTGILLVCVVATAIWSWRQLDVAPERLPLLVFGGAIGGLIFAMVTIFKKEWAPLTAPIYALLEGLVLGGISALYERQSQGIAMQAVALTFGVLFVMLLAYRSGLIRVTDSGIALFYIIEIVLGFFGIHFVSINTGTPLGIGFSLLVVGIAALNLVLDFDLIEHGVAAGAPKYMEWYAAFGLMVTLIWLYLEILRLLSKIRSRR
ncbi:MAG: hypothetical protein DMG68_05205 [Acidobacteria bacterium]|nr:MAG: hypothetical protein DMG68_05205 [Acidobacteriota bacterium]